MKQLNLNFIHIQGRIALKMASSNTNGSSDIMEEYGSLYKEDIEEMVVKLGEKITQKVCGQFTVVMN